MLMQSRRIGDLKPPTMLPARPQTLRYLLAGIGRQPKSGTTPGLIQADSKLIHRLKAFSKKRNATSYDLAGIVSEQELESVIKTASDLQREVVNSYFGGAMTSGMSNVLNSV